MLRGLTITEGYSLNRVRSISFYLFIPILHEEEISHCNGEKEVSIN